MLRKTLSDIHSYISFLEKCGYTVSFSSFKNHFAPFTVELLKYDFHPHAVCNYLKQNPKTAGRCSKNKQALIKQGIKEPYYGCCYAGVEEYLFPLLYEDELILCIHISGYRGKHPRSSKAIKEISLLCTDRFPIVYNELSDDVPTFEHCLSFVAPLQYMMMELYKNCKKQKSEDVFGSPTENLYLKALEFITENYFSPITCETIAKHLSYSSSYIRYIFKKEGNITVQEKINEVRLTNAKRLLRGTLMSVTDIAFSVGFSDSNYFSIFFKKHEKMSPKEYRKKAY